MDIEIDQKEVSENVKTILNAATSSQAIAVKQSYSIIINTAKLFNVKYQQMINKINTYETLLKECIKSWHDVKKTLGSNYKDTSAYKNYRINRNKIRQENWNKEIQNQVKETYKLAMEFQAQINAALKQNVATTYVWVGKSGVPQTYIIYDMSKFLQTDVDRYGNVVVRYRNNIKMLQQHTQKIENLVNKNSQNFNYQKLIQAYQKSSYRFKTYKVIKGGASFILWLNPSNGQKWHGVLVSSLGSINEAYANLLVHESFNPSNILEDEMEQFMNTVLGVTNLSGVLQGDTFINNLQLAVKSKGATTLSIQQLYDISMNIVDLKLNNFDAIKNYLKQVKQNNKAVQSPLNKSFNQALKNVTEDSLEPIIALLKNK